jgi:hypothetical protein
MPELYTSRHDITSQEAPQIASNIAEENLKFTRFEYSGVIKETKIRNMFNNFNYSRLKTCEKLNI